MPTILSPDQRAAFERDGCVLVSGFFDPDETTLLQRAMETAFQIGMECPVGPKESVMPTWSDAELVAGTTRDRRITGR